MLPPNYSIKEVLANGLMNSKSRDFIKKIRMYFIPKSLHLEGQQLTDASKLAE